jgi:ribosomal protein L10
MSGGHSDKKVAYFARFQALLRDSSRILLVEADNVGSKLMQDIRLSFRGHATLVMGKNTMMRKAIREILPERPALENLLPIVKGNVGLIFTNGELSTITAILKEHKVEAAARTGATAQCDVTIPAGNTGLEPTQTSFLQALNIASKITKGLIEILNPVQICFEGVRVGPSEATLLAKLKIKPFKYGLEPRTVYLDSGETFPASVLDISNEAILCRRYRQRRGPLARDRVPHRGVVPARHDQRVQEPAPRVHRHRVHLQAVRADQGDHRQPGRVRGRGPGGRRRRRRRCGGRGAGARGGGVRGGHARPL